MRDLLFKNLTSEDKKRKIISSSEVFDKEGVRSTIHRHFACMVKEVAAENIDKPLPYLYVLKMRNGKEHREEFYCRVKGSVYALNKGKLFLVFFMHSLKIKLQETQQPLAKQ
ncbi:MAG TPA: hypothetical protein VMD04_01500 [Candidatus Margulisiibacteriota bacterium]|nr:hypothetical protein [Candidatus Margulisiibacteriota bacterium]